MIATDDLTLGLLKLISSRSSLTLSGIAAIANTSPINMAEPIHWLIDKGYIRISTHFPNKDIEVDLRFDSILEITYDGRIMFAQVKKEEKRFKYVEIRAWITLSIAIIALIVSVIALILGA